MQDKADIGLIGLAVMGENLVLNMESRGFTVAVFNRTVDKVVELHQGPRQGEELRRRARPGRTGASLKSPRTRDADGQGGRPVDELIDELLPLLEPGDIVIDGGNTYYPDTMRRTQDLEEKGLLFIGTGVSGGEEGALLGPSLMPGGSRSRLAPGEAHLPGHRRQGRGRHALLRLGRCRGAGHYVKMVHNGIEYGDMQLICESYES